MGLNSGGARQQKPDTSCPTRRQEQALLGEIRTIAGGFVGGGATTLRRKAHARQAKYHEVFSADKPSKYPKLEVSPIISFKEEDWEGILYPHDNALVVTLLITNYRTRLILVDNGSSANILFWEAFTKMGINPNRQWPSPTPLKGFFWRSSPTRKRHYATGHNGPRRQQGHDNDRILDCKSPLFIQHHTRATNPE